MKKEYQKEYEAYMKKVTDAFIDMQPQEINDRIPYKIIWEGELEYNKNNDYDILLIANEYDDVKGYNQQIAKKYLRVNTLSYGEWIEKYKNS